MTRAGATADDIHPQDAGVDAGAGPRAGTTHRAAPLRVVACGAAGNGASSLIARLSHAAAGHRFIAADGPGHRHFLSDMIAAAATADLALVVVDAHRGVSADTRRHSYLLALLGIRHVLLAVNKMDLVDFAAPRFAAIEREYREYAARVGLETVACIPVCARDGDNVAARGGRAFWYDGPSLLEYIDTAPEAPVPDAARAFRLIVESVTQSAVGRRAIAGRILGGGVRAGDRVRVLPSGRRSVVAQVTVGAADVIEAAAPEFVTLLLTDEVEVHRGDVVCVAEAPPGVADQFEATIVWMHAEPLLQGRDYILKIGNRSVAATVAPIKYRVNVETSEQLAAKKLGLDEIGVCGLKLESPVVFEPYSDSPALGGFTLIDGMSHHTVGAGLLHFALRRSQNVHWQALDVNKRARAQLSGQSPCILWFTGLSGAGKSTIANLVEKLLHAAGRQTYLLDGDNVRHGLSKDLGFTQEDRVESVRRVAEVARLMVDAGLIVLVSSISPFRAERRMARALVETGEFFEIFVDTTLQAAEARDVKGLYKKARRGELKNFTGIDSPYEAPEAPEIRLDTALLSPEEAAAQVFAQVSDALAASAARRTKAAED